jgi:hypothetical protein
MRDDRPSDIELTEARNILQRSTINGLQCCSSGGSFDGKHIGVRQVKDILLQKNRTPQEDLLLWACNVEIADIDYYYRYEKDYG